MITIEQNADKEQATEQWGWLAVGISIGTMVLMAGLIVMGIRQWRKRGSRNRNKRAGNKEEQLPVMEMRLLGLEQQDRSGSRATRHGNFWGIMENLLRLNKNVKDSKGTFKASEEIKGFYKIIFWSFEEHWKNS
jgi:hypothetical protein